MHILTTKLKIVQEKKLTSFSEMIVNLIKVLALQ